MRKADPSLSYPDVLRKISSAWNSMLEDDKKLWQDVTAKKTEAYDKARSEYAAANPNGFDASSVPAAEPKKRGRKSAADKQKELDEVAHQIAVTLDTPKEKKKKTAAAPAPKPVEESSEESSESDTSGSDDDSSSEEETAPPPKKSKSKKAEEPAKKEKKSKK